jgi:dTDP-4-amino-4,6-dideoxygalactose transaminase
MTIPLVDLQIQHHQIKEEVEAAFERIMSSGAFVSGPDVARFESEFADLCGVPHCMGVANGTDALDLCLRALDIGPGDEVIIPANTFVATGLAVIRAGATPVLVDATDDDLLMDAEAAEAAIGPRTRAIMPVDLFGQVAPMDLLEPIAREAGIALIEDAAQSQGARQGDRPAGSFGDMAGTSFYPGKNLGAYGDAGAVMTSNAAFAERVRCLRNYGSEVKYHHPEPGFNSRLDTLQAAVLLAKLVRLPAWNDERRAAAKRYDERLAGVAGVRVPTTRKGNEHVWHIYAVRLAGRDAILTKLNDAGIGAGIHYPVPVHLQGAFENLGYRRGAFPISEAAAEQMISLPLYPGITERQQDEVVDALRSAL